jgi:hypothetical protein
MKYMLLIYGDEQQRPEPESTAMAEEGAKYEVFTKSIIASGNFVDGDPFLPTTTATTVEVRGGKTKTSGGPVEKTALQLQAYYKVEAENEEQAVEMASRIPGAQYGAIEVRPVVQFD